MNSEDKARSASSVNNKDNLPSSSQMARISDNNANVNVATDESKGAIPKTKIKIVKKTNNNIESNISSTSNSPFINDASGATAAKMNGRFNGGPCTNCINEISFNEWLTTQQHTEESPIAVPTVEIGPFNIPPDNGCNDLITVDNPNDLHSDDPTCGHNFTGQPLNNVDDSDTSSSDDNELLSVSDDGCIYTYKGDHVADLPSSFFCLEVPVLEDAPGEGREENSSPEMDFLEMDFDPGPSGDADSDSISNAEIDNAANLPLDEARPPIAPLLVETSTPGCSKDPETNVQSPSIHKCEDNATEKPLNVTKEFVSMPRSMSADFVSAATSSQVPMVSIDHKMPWSCSVAERTRSARNLRVVKRHHNSKGELTSPNEGPLNGGDMSNITNLTSFHMATAKISIDEKNAMTNDGDKVMIWTNEEACLKQITQVGPSACGATAVLNVLNALRFPIPTIERVQECVNTRLRSNTSPLPEYLMSRSKAGCNHRDLIAGLYKLSDEKIYSRFFALYPERIVNLQTWLGYWIRNGAVPIATVNLQKSDGHIPDSWHHQMIFGVDPEGIYMTNPLECVDPSQLWPQLSSESVLLVKSSDVISRIDPRVDLQQLMMINDVRWRRLNVVGQVARVVRESRRCVDHTLPNSHIKIPAEYTAGITLAIDISAPGFNLLRHCPELPLLQPDSGASAF